ncbi:hypothetical protein J2X06_003323 [Lysobacter niastensis]|uniref:Uncharacterized protein n=1 Tax=Lysobacter niastensis TaxID=380629 RepID=A0ABU1WFH3_9GAMM|nr:hypothetical protein [Lysobacter niastensis]MDR7136105.1 hypothetical protein [Lysobacter niastensis]
MSKSESHASTKPPNVFPLTFREHNFNAYCYGTIGCSVIYANQQQSAWSGRDEVTPPPESPDYREEWQGTHAGIRNFPPPAEVRWRSLDGVAHEAKVDIGAIFKDQRVLHRVPESDYAEQSFGGSPDIILEVNDRTISVYMKAFVATINEQIPGNRYSYGREDLIMAWSRTY